VKLTFVGPVTTNHIVAKGQRIRSVYFVLMQAGSNPIKLEYSSKAEAKDARAQLLKTDNVFPVPSNRLLQAIHEALSQQQEPENDRFSRFDLTE